MPLPAHPPGVALGTPPLPTAPEAPAAVEPQRKPARASVGWLGGAWPF